MKRVAPVHRRPGLRKAGIVLIVVGAIVFFAPMPPRDGLDDAARMMALARIAYWKCFAGTALLFLGNVLRLIGEQGHPGLPWPLFRPGNHDALARWIIRRRLAFHRRHPKATPRRRLAAAR